jgi:feruloyl esterase
LRQARIAADHDQDRRFGNANAQRFEMLRKLSQATDRRAAQQIAGKGEKRIVHRCSGSGALLVTAMMARRRSGGDTCVIQHNSLAIKNARKRAAMKQHWAMGSLALATALLAGSGTAQAQAPAQEQPASETAEPACASLVRAAFPDATTTLSLAALRPPTAAEARGADDRMQGPPAPAMPAHCEVIGKLQERQGANGQTYAIKFHLRLPVQWNGRFVFQGGGGSDGNLGDATGGFSSQPGVTALGQGYAVISSDSGHDNAVNNDPARQGVVTFGHDALARHNYGFGYIGPVVQVGKALIRAYYHRAPAFTYFVGGSKGGQEAMMAVQRFPAEFDAALIGYPGFHLAHASIAQLWDGQAFGSVAKAMGQIGRDGLPLVNKAMSDQDILLAQGAILKACDALDGRTDGMIEHFTACTTARVLPKLAKVTCASDNPANKTAACLLPMQVAALRKVMGGPRTHDGQAIYSNWAWDAGIGAQTAKGMTQGWRIWKMGAMAPTPTTGRCCALAPPAIRRCSAHPRWTWRAMSRRSPATRSMPISTRPITMRT